VGPKLSLCDGLGWVEKIGPTDNFGSPKTCGIRELQRSGNFQGISLIKMLR